MAKKRKGKGKAKDRIQAVKVKVRPAYLDRDPYSFDPIEDWVWHEYESSKTASVIDFIDKYYKNSNWYIGTDSQQYSKPQRCIFTTVLIAHHYDKDSGMGCGGSVIRYIDKRPKIPLEALSARLTVEVQRSIEICKFLETELLNRSDDKNDYWKNIIGISIDCNKDLKNKSARYKDALVGMVVGYGWNAFVKPDAWASSNVADRSC